MNNSGIILLVLALLLSFSCSIGCSGGQEEPTAEELEKVRQHHIQQAKRFQQEG
jgi:outer membrane biogenesis lipoprotein LolB